MPQAPLHWLRMFGHRSQPPQTQPLYSGNLFRTLVSCLRSWQAMPLCFRWFNFSRPSAHLLAPPAQFAQQRAPVHVLSTLLAAHASNARRVSLVQHVLLVLRVAPIAIRVSPVLDAVWTLHKHQLPWKLAIARTVSAGQAEPVHVMLVGLQEMMESPAPSVRVASSSRQIGRAHV